MTHEEVRTVHTLREQVKETSDCGMLGVLAARARIDESKLRAWCADFAAMPDAREIVALNEVIHGESPRQQLAQLYGAMCEDC